MTAPACWPRRGTVNGVRTIAFCTDATVMGGAMGDEGCAHIVDAYDTAIEERSPIIGLWHSGGARLAEGVVALHAVGQIFAAMIRASGKIPQISVVLGPAAGGAAYGPALTDVVILARTAGSSSPAPTWSAVVTGEDVDMVRLGGPEPHGRRSGVVHIVTDAEHDALERGRRLVGTARPAGHFDRAKAEAGDTDLQALLPESQSAPTTCTRSSRRCSTRAAVRSCTPSGRRTSSTALGRLGGRTVGVIANNPLRLGGCLDSRRGEGGPVRADVRRVRRAAGRRRRRARLPARRRPGVGRRRAPRREAAARVRRGRRCRGSRW